MVTGDYFSNKFRRTRKAERGKTKEKQLFYQDFQVLCHDNALAHRSAICRRTNTELGIGFMIHPSQNHISFLLRLHID